MYQKVGIEPGHNIVKINSTPCATLHKQKECTSDFLNSCEKSENEDKEIQSKYACDRPIRGYNRNVVSFDYEDNVASRQMTSHELNTEHVEQASGDDILTGITSNSSNFAIPFGEGCSIKEATRILRSEEKYRIWPNNGNEAKDKNRTESKVSNFDETLHSKQRDQQVVQR